MREEQGLDLALGEHSCRVDIHRSARAKRLTLRVASATGIVRVTAPPGIRMSMIEGFLDRHREWISERLEKLPARVRFSNGALLPLRGELHQIKASGSLRGLVAARGEEGGVPVLTVPGAPAHMERRLVDFLKNEARRDLEKAVGHYLERTGKAASRIVIRDGVSRWGSCAANGVLSFSWRLILAPSFILDYVAAHEVAHLTHMNHGPRYWRLLREICPATDDAKAWMTKNGRQLHAYGPPPGRKGEPKTL